MAPNLASRNLPTKMPFLSFSTKIGGMFRVWVKEPTQNQQEETKETMINTTNRKMDKKRRKTKGEENQKAPKPQKPPMGAGWVVSGALGILVFFFSCLSPLFCSWVFWVSSSCLSSLLFLLFFFLVLVSWLLGVFSCFAFLIFFLLVFLVCFVLILLVYGF